MSLKSTVQARLADRKLMKRMSRAGRASNRPSPRPAQSLADAAPPKQPQLEDGQKEEKAQKEQPPQKPKAETRQKEEHLQRSQGGRALGDTGQSLVRTADDALEGAAPDGLSRTADVVLDVPSLRVEEIALQVESLDARVALRAEVANLVRLDVGAQVGIGKVDLDIKGVEAQAQLRVRLDQVQEIITRALQALEHNPELLRAIGRLAEIGPRIGEAAAGALEGTGTTVAKALAKEGPAMEAVRSATHGLEDAVTSRSTVHEEQRRDPSRREEDGRKA